MFSALEALCNALYKLKTYLLTYSEHSSLLRHVSLDSNYQHLITMR